ncbi:MAG TPA: hypothetical protein GXX58_11805 [Gelria sp.]|nr:hypothetical protein [Gelria sp.]
MPGIPPSGTPEAVAFSISFWSALYSGAIYSVITGLIVGLLMWFIQVWAEARRLRHDYSREVGILKDKLRAIVDQPDVLSIDSAEQSAPPAAKEVYESLQLSLIEEWAKTLPASQEFTQTLQKFHESYSAFLVNARKLDYYLKQAIRNHNGGQGIITPNDKTNHAYFVGRIHYSSTDALLHWLDRSPEAYDRLEETHRILIEDSEVKKSLKPYRKSLSDVTEALRSLRDFLAMR